MKKEEDFDKLNKTGGERNDKQNDQGSFESLSYDSDSIDDDDDDDDDSELSYDSYDSQKEVKYPIKYLRETFGDHPWYDRYERERRKQEIKPNIEKPGQKTNRSRKSNVKQIKVVKVYTNYNQPTIKSTNKELKTLFAKAAKCTSNKRKK